MKESMLKRISLAILLAIQAIGGGAVTLAHARDVVVAPPAFEASHSHGCPILHDEVRCALCHYMNARVVSQHRFTIPTPAETTRFTPVQPVFPVATLTRLTVPARAPPVLLS